MLQIVPEEELVVAKSKLEEIQREASEKLEEERKLKREKRILQQQEEQQQQQQQQQHLVEVQQQEEDVLHEQDPQAVNIIDLKKKQNNAGVRYISLKPLKKDNPVQIQELESGDEDDEEFEARSPVPLPDASQCKPILMKLGVLETSVSENAGEKKVLRYADGVLPGQGSPDHTNDEDESLESEDDDEEDEDDTDVPKQRKKILIRVIRTKFKNKREEESESSDEDHELDPKRLLPPAPPKGRPKFYHTQEFKDKFALKIENIC